MRISVNNSNFSAKFYPYPNTITDPKIFKMFEERTKCYPDFILKQDDISYFKNDYFMLVKKDKPNLVSHGYFSFTHNRPKNIENIIDRLEQIFDTLRHKRIPEMHVDY